MAAELEAVPDASAGHFRCKGLVYREIAAELSALSAGERAEFLEDLADPTLRAFTNQIFLAGGWYDVLPMVAWSEVAARRAGLPLEQYLRQRAIVTANRDLSGVHRTILKVVSPKLAMYGLVRVTARYFDFGSTALTSEEPDRVVVSRKGLPRALNPWYAHVSSPYMQIVLEHAGARDVRIDFSAKSRSAANSPMPLCDMTFNLCWR